MVVEITSRQGTTVGGLRAKNATESGSKVISKSVFGFVLPRFA